MTASIPKTDPHLPTPTSEFWEALSVVRTYLLFNKADEVFALPPLQFRGKYDLKNAFWIVDRYLDLMEMNKQDCTQC